MLEKKADYLIKLHENREVYKIKSFSRKEEYHIVWKRLDGTLDCSCEYKQIYRKRKCDHIRKVQHIKLKWHGRNNKNGK